MVDKQEYKVVEFTPANEKQKKFMFSTKPFILFSGAVNAGKSFLGCWKCFMLTQLYPGARILICRKEGASLVQSTLVTLFDKVIPQEMIIRKSSDKHGSGEVTLTTPDKDRPSKIIWSGLDKKANQDYPTKIGSTEYLSIFVDEIMETDLSDFEMLMTRTRQTFDNLSIEENNAIPRSLFGATNPEAPTHYLYKFFFKEQNEDRDLIIATIYDNPYASKFEIRKLETSLTGLRKLRLLEGKWVQAEGAIYDTFDIELNVTKFDLINNILHYKEFIGGADSNFPIPRAGGIFGITANGEKHLLREFYEPNSQPEDLGKWFNDFAVKYNIGITVYHDPSDPSAIAKIDSYSNIDCVKAMNAVSSGISCVHKEITNRKLLIDESCVNTIQYLGSYKWKKGSKEQPEKKEDHLCFVAGTKIQTINGEKNIEDLTLIDFVLTREGYKKINFCIESLEPVSVLEITLSNNQKIICTKDHPFYVKNMGWLKAESLSNFYILVDTFSYLWKTKYLMEEVIIKAKMDIGEKVEDLNIFIETFGNTTKEKFLMDFMSIIKTKIKITTKYLILNVVQQKNIDKNTHLLKNKLKQIEKILTKLDHLLKNGTKVKKEENGIKNIIKKVLVKVTKKKNISAKSAVKSLLVKLFKELNSATKIVKPKIFVKDIKKLKKKQKVYNLNVCDCHEYFANGVLVSNCDMVRYALFTYDNQTIESSAAMPEPI